MNKLARVIFPNGQEVMQGVKRRAANLVDQFVVSARRSGRIDNGQDGNGKKDCVVPRVHGDMYVCSRVL